MIDFSTPIGTRCLNPQKIVNPYTNELLVVPCRKCSACIASKNSRFATMCDLESECHDKTMFITLTYADNYVPLMDYNHDTNDFYEIENGEVLFNESFSPRYIQEIKDKCNLHGYLPYNRKSDLQKFLKRLRYYAAKRFNAKIRYFAVAEMGPVHFRPHFHLLLWSDSEKFLSKIGYFVYKAWSFGLYDVQIAENGASSYVASYLNSDSCVPPIFQNNAVRPFQVHSSHLGKGILQNARKEIYKIPAEEIVRRIVTIKGQPRDVTLWRSYYSYFFPKVRGYVDFNAQEKYYAYSIYQTTVDNLPFHNSVISYAQFIYGLISVFSDNTAIDYDISANGKLRDIIRFFTESDYDYNTKDEERISRHINRIYTQLLISRHFLLNVCDTPNDSFPTMQERKSKIRRIDEFYSRLDYLHLVDWFESQRMFYETDVIGDEDKLIDDVLPYFYDNYTYDITAYKELKVYSRLDNYTTELMHKRIKHKYANDLNKKFMYDFGSMSALGEDYLFTELR